MVKFTYCTRNLKKVYMFLLVPFDVSDRVPI